MSSRLARPFARPAAAAVVAALLAAALAGCSSTNLDNKAPVETRNTGPAAAASAPDTSGAASSTVTTVDLTKNNADAGKLERVVYFDFDSFVIKDEYKPLIEANAKALKADPNKQMVVEGHTDERGGREYNLALGQKRAEAVVKAMELLGVADNQLEATSFGKEHPAVQGSNEEAWAKNRRAELRDR
jgi:peptidoglycan-associated lipoprotein